LASSSASCHKAYADHLTAPIFSLNGPATTEIYTLSLHDALPICRGGAADLGQRIVVECRGLAGRGIGIVIGHLSLPGSVGVGIVDRKSTRLNSSHVKISYAVFCLKKKKKRTNADRSNY